jgi:acetoin utilization protein AcuB
MALPISEVMKRNVLLAERNEGVSMSLARMDEAGVRQLPVVDNGRHLIGMVSERELGRAAAMMQAAEGRRELLRVRDVMRPEVLRIPRDMPAHEAAALMIANKIGMLTVVDEEGAVCGIVTAADFLEIARDALSS